MAAGSDPQSRQRTCLDTTEGYDDSPGHKRQEGLLPLARGPLGLHPSQKAPLRATVQHLPQRDLCLLSSSHLGLQGEGAGRSVRWLWGAGDVDTTVAASKPVLALAFPGWFFPLSRASVPVDWPLTPGLSYAGKCWEEGRSGTATRCHPRGKGNRHTDG